MKYIWTKYNLLEHIDVLERLKINKSKKEIKEIDWNIEIIKDFISELETLGDFMSTKEFLESNNDFLKRHDFMLSDLESALYNDVVYFDHEPQFNKEQYSKDTILTITHDFYKSFDKELFSVFSDVFKKRYSNVVFEDSKDENIEAITFGIPYLKEVYIMIRHAKGLVPIYSSVHEYAHAIAFLMHTENLLPTGKSFLAEVYSQFFELVLSDYLSKNKKLNHVYDYSYDAFGEFINMAVDVNEMINLDKLYREIGFTKNKDFKLAALDKFDYEKDYVDQITSNCLEGEVPYLYGYLVAVELYELYKFDKDKAIYVLKKLMLLNNLTELEYYKEMKKLGIYPNSHIADYASDLQDKLIRK